MNNNLMMYFKYRSEQRKFLKRSRDRICQSGKKTALYTGKLATLVLIVVIMVASLSVAFVVAFVFHCSWLAFLLTLVSAVALSIIITEFWEDQIRRKNA